MKRPILNYHAVGTDPAVGLERWTISPQLLGDHLDALAERGLRGVSLREALDHPDPHQVALTFDDGYEDFVTHAVPLLRERGFTASLYVVTGDVGSRARWPGGGGRTMASWSQLREIDRLGFEVASHGHRHHQLDLLETRDLVDDVHTSKAVLEEQLGHEVSGFCYPHGFHSQRVRATVIDAGFAYACAVKHKMSSDDDDRFALARIVVDADTPVERVHEWLSGKRLRRGGLLIEQTLATGFRAYRRGRSQISEPAVARSAASRLKAKSPDLVHIVPVQVIRAGSRVRTRALSWQARRRLRPLVEAVARSTNAPPEFGSFEPEYAVLSGASDRAVLALSTACGRRLIMKVGWSERSQTQIAREVDALHAIHGNTLDELGSLVPHVVSEGEHEAGRWMIQTAVPGRPLDPAGGAGNGLVDDALRTIAVLHDATRALALDAEEPLLRFIGAPIATIRTIRPRWSSQLEMLELLLRQTLEGRPLILSSIHGDFAPSNVLSDDRGLRIVGLVDWELAQNGMLPEIDLGHMILTAGGAELGIEHGELMEPVLAGERSQLLERVSAAAACGPNELPPRVTLTLAWLHHVHANLSKSEQFRTNPVWLSANIDRPLGAMATGNWSQRLSAESRTT